MKTIKQNIPIRSVSKDTIARSEEVFTGYIDSDFEKYGTDKKSPKTAETKVAVLEMDKDGTFKQIFDSISADTDSMSLTQAQIIEFCKTNKDDLRQGGYATFFLFKGDLDFFVAYVRVIVGELEVYVLRFSRDDVWSAEFRHRFVVPQLALGKVDTSVTLTPNPSDTLPTELVINGVTYVKK